jgi:hypothetical protein
VSPSPAHAFTQKHGQQNVTHAASPTPHRHHGQKEDSHSVTDGTRMAVVSVGNTQSSTPLPAKHRGDGGAGPSSSSAASFRTSISSNNGIAASGQSDSRLMVRDEGWFRCDPKNKECQMTMGSSFIDPIVGEFSVFLLVSGCPALLFEILFLLQTWFYTVLPHRKD